MPDIPASPSCWCPHNPTLQRHPIVVVSLPDIPASPSCWCPHNPTLQRHPIVVVFHARHSSLTFLLVSSQPDTSASSHCGCIPTRPFILNLLPGAPPTRH